MPNFDSLAGFIAFLPELAARVKAAEQQGREAAAETVHREVVASFGGAPGGDTGPFPALAPLQAATEAARQRHGFAPDEPELATGALRDSVSTTVAPDGRAVVGVADAIVGSGRPGDAFRNIGDVAVAQEEGSSRLPQRSFLGISGFRAAEAAAAAFVAPVVAALSGTSSGGEANRGDD